MGDAMEGPLSSRLTAEERAQIRAIGAQLSRILQGQYIEQPASTSRDELGILANLANSVARELEQNRQRDAHSRQELEARLQELKDANRVQSELLARIQELSSPVLHVGEGILLLPVIGAVDAERAQHLLITLLDRIKDTRSRVAILDLTGAPSIDATIANRLLRVISAVALIGARTFICGLSPRAAQAALHAGADLSAVQVYKSLDSALLAANAWLKTQSGGGGRV